MAAEPALRPLAPAASGRSARGTDTRSGRAAQENRIDTLLCRAPAGALIALLGPLVRAAFGRFSRGSLPRCPHRPGRRPARGGTGRNRP